MDTAAVYENEENVGRAIRDSGVDADDIFVTTKVWTTDHGHDTILRAFEESRAKLGLETIDLYLIHWPARREPVRWPRKIMRRTLTAGQESPHRVH